MTTKTAPSVIQMGREDLQTLLTSVNETLATDAHLLKPLRKQKRFGTLELWQLRRTSRYSGIAVR